MTMFAVGLVAKAQHQAPFPILDVNLYDKTNLDPSSVLIPASPLEYDVLFTGGVDLVTNKNGVTALAKEWQDFTGFVPIDGRSDSGYVIVNHERLQADPVNGDGGGMTVFTIYLDPVTGKWEVVDDVKGKFRNVDFSGVGGTGANCGGIQTSWGKVFTAEEWGSAFPNNPAIFGNGFSDTTDWNVTMFNGAPVDVTIPRYKNFQYMVEVDVENTVAVRKNYNMGKYDHEGGWIASDRKTVYLSDDKSSGSVLFRFVAEAAEDFSKGQLSFYKQSVDGMSGTWMDIPMTMDNMLNARDYAFANGATIFMRLEWVEGINDNTVFITETGRGKRQSIAGPMSKGGIPAKHLTEMESWDDADSSFNDVYGRVLRLNTVSGKIESAIEGGGALVNDTVPVNNHLSSPDGLASVVIDGKTYLVINEDMNPSGAPASPSHFASKLNEIYFVDVTGDAPGKMYSVDTDLYRFLVGPKGCETTGGRFTPDGKTYIVNMQHPSDENVSPFDHSTTIAVRGFDKYLKMIMADAERSEEDLPFKPINKDFYDKEMVDLPTVMIPASPFKYETLFVGGVDYVRNAQGDSALAKEWQDFTGYVPIDGRSDSGYVIVNHERMNRDAVNGDGGGMTVFTAWLNPVTEKWEVTNDSKGKFRNVDFSNVGGTAANCGGIQTEWGKVFTAEEWGVFFSNAAINNPGAFGLGFAYDPGNQGGFADTSDINITSFNGDPVDLTIKKHENFQFMVEVDVANAVAVRKNYNMGKYDHEGGWIASDRKTVYLSDDNSGGSVLFRFVAETVEDFSKGQLSFYKQSADGMTGTWMDIPMTFEDMMDPKDFAFANGATLFMRLEWVEGIDDNTVFITETGRGKRDDFAGPMAEGAMPAKHIMDMPSWEPADSSFDDQYGRVLRLNVASGKVEVAVEGGGVLASNNKPVNNHLSSPDGLASVEIDGKVYLVINEDMNPSGSPANPSHFSSKLNEIYFVDVTNDEAGVMYSVEKDLHRFLVGPKGCETTGGRFTPDGKTYFVNMQHPTDDNDAPFNHSTTIAITGFDDYLVTGLDTYEFGASEDGSLKIYPNPASKELNLNGVYDIAIYDDMGQRIMVRRGTNRIDVSQLKTGMYFIQTVEGEVQKLIIE